MMLRIRAIAFCLGCVASPIAAAPAAGALGRKEIATAFDLMSWGTVDPIDKGTLAKACADPMRAKVAADVPQYAGAGDIKPLTKFYDTLLTSGGAERTLVQACIEGMIAATNQRGGYVDVEKQGQENRDSILFFAAAMSARSARAGSIDAAATLLPMRAHADESVAQKMLIKDEAADGDRAEAPELQPQAMFVMVAEEGLEPPTRGL